MKAKTYFTIKLLITSIQRKCNFHLEVRSPDTSRFPQAAGEPPRATALRGLT